jgi:peptidyl-prolyl cis-trans isomerase SurA
LRPQADSVPMTKPYFKTFVFCSAALWMAWLPVVQAQTLRASPGLSAPRAANDNSQRSADFIVAIVNSEPITNIEVRARVLRFEQQLSQRGGAMPSRSELSVQVLERLISERAQVQVGRDNGIKIDETMINGAVQNVARQNQLSVDELRRRLEAEGISYGQFRAGLRDEMLLARVREREVDNRVQVSEPELDQFIAEQQDSASTNPAEINLAQILIAVPESITAQQQQELQTRADGILRRARAGEDFASLAREFSQSAERANGGVMGLRSAERYPLLFVEATQSLRVGDLSALVRSGAGFHILKVIDKKRATAANVSVVQTRARHILVRPSAQLSESAARARLVDLRKRITSGQIDFATAARDNSQDGSAREGGDLGWANPGQFVPEFEEVMNQLAPGQVSEPLVSRFGVHLIQLQERRENALDARKLARKES